MRGLVKAARFSAYAAGAVLLALPLAAQAAGRNDVRMQILDRCVLSQSGRAPLDGAGPECKCYAAKIIKAMTDEEVARYRRSVPRRLSEEANAIMAACQ